MKKESNLNIKGLVGTVSLVAIVSAFGGTLAKAERTERDLVSGSQVSTNGYSNYYLEYMNENYLNKDPRKMKEARRRSKRNSTKEYTEEEVEVIDEEEYARRNARRRRMQEQDEPTVVQTTTTEEIISREVVGGNENSARSNIASSTNNASGVVVTEQTEVVEDVRTGDAKAKKAQRQTIAKDEVVEENNEESSGLFYSMYKDEDEEDNVARKRENSNDDDVGGSRRESEEDEVSRRDRDYDRTLFYIRAMAGKGKLGKYKMTIDDPINMKTNKNKLDLSVALGWGFANQWDVEIEGEKIDWKDIKPEAKINDALIDYNHKIKTVSAGINAIYNLADYRSTWLTPFIGFGVGMTQFKLADYGTTWSLEGKQIDSNGDIVSENTPGAEETMFESGYEKKTRPYAKLIAGLTLKLGDYTSLVLKGDYKVFNSIKYSMIDEENADVISMKISDLSTVTAGAGLRINF